MKDETFIIDAVVHMNDFSETLAIHEDARIVRNQMAGFIQYATQRGPPANERFAEEVDLDWANKKLFEESQTDMAVAQTVPLYGMMRDGIGPPRLNYQLAASNPARILFCGGVDPLYQGIRGALDEMQRQVEEWGAISFKFYQAQLTGVAWRADDRVLAYPLYEKAQELGIRFIQFHKGLPLGRSSVEDLRPNDLQQVAVDFPDLNIGIHHLGDPYIDETFSILSRFENTCWVLPMLLNRWFVEPVPMTHWLGQGLKYVGEDRMLYGTDGFVWPSFQAYIDLVDGFEIPQDLQDGYGYPALTPAGKQKILGLNAARYYGIDIARKREELGLAPAAA